MPPSIDALYGGDPDLLHKVRIAVGQRAELESLFVDIAHHFRNSDGTDEPGSKRRKKNDGSHDATNGVGSQDSGKKTVVLEIKDVSFSMPQRKKMHWSIIHYGDRLADPNSYALAITDPKTGHTELEASLSKYAHVLCLPVPEKPQKSFNYCFIPASTPNTPTDAIVFTLPSGPLKTLTLAPSYTQTFPPPTSPSSSQPLDSILDTILPLHNLTLITPSATQFISSFPEVQRKNEPAYHVKAHIGTKDGYLFFLSTGIFFGFKKPLKFLPLENIDSTAFVRPVSRTFGLAIAYREDGGVKRDGDEEDDAGVEEVEFDQIDNQEHGGINEYIQRHGIQDGSFAENRKAKILKKDKTAATGGQLNGEEGEDGDGRTELEKAEQQLQDEEDEEEEDYDPDEEDDESGSESGSEDDGFLKGRGKDLVGEELGSEAEDVSDDEEDEEEEEEEDELEEDEEEQDDAPAGKVLPQRPPESSIPAISARTAGEPDPEDDDQL